jgi:hypothetical protein
MCMLHIKHAIGDHFTIPVYRSTALGPQRAVISGLRSGVSIRVFVELALRFILITGKIALYPVDPYLRGTRLELAA